ncbi:DUF2752 domain-containing protein [Streptomyces griseoviridis]|uniref:DUF2752 domain-containing protein n=1 Tax=Streptomyces griseoviridis TaxID=45398 RepID=A0ABT9LGR3_STRGD|nr:DUF2752 domain-containing protein [Streptomyces griseoviridis]MDP9682445.1 hypothetical protein [Streptomyces griseoviridis]GGS81385.1 hypothetical protein GCM10010240_13390 [Streptomyces griseoviridis]
MADAAGRTGPRAVHRPRSWHPAAAPLAVLAAGAAGAAYLYTTDPHQPGHVLPRCPFRLVTGLLCPACGGTRMVYDLMHGQFAAAWADNRLLLLVSPVALALLARWAWEGLRGRRWRPNPGRVTQALILATAVVWAVVRNLVQ